MFMHIYIVYTAFPPWFRACLRAAEMRSNYLVARRIPPGTSRDSLSERSGKAERAPRLSPEAPL